MNTPLKLAAYGAALAVLVSATYAVGTVVGTPGDAPTSSTAMAGHAHPAAGPAALPGGLASSSAGYTLVPDGQTLVETTGGSGAFAFRVTGPDGAPATSFDEASDKRMHLIVVRRDTTGFQHLHPQMDADGTWRVPLTVAAGGVYRAFADFVPSGGPPTVLGVDLFAAGDFQPVMPAPSRAATVDGYAVTLDGDLTAAMTSPLRFTVTRDGAPVAVQPYLGASGHLVVLREGDLAYLHVHPTGAAGGPLVFDAQVPTAGTYRLFLDFQVDGVVRTADFTVATAGSAS